MDSNDDGGVYAPLPALDSLTWVQGSAQDVTRHSYKLCLLFQVNCPGCHTHAIPVANELFLQQQQQTRMMDQKKKSTGSSDDDDDDDDTVFLVDVFAISTAFEDFEFNTAESTRLLIEQGRRVGVVREQLGEQASFTDHGRSSSSSSDDTSPQIPQMPVAMDPLVARRSEACSPQLLAQALGATRHNVRQHFLQNASAALLPKQVLEQALAQVQPDTALPEYLARVFYCVAAPGTPTWIVWHEDPPVPPSGTRTAAAAAAARPEYDEGSRGRVLDRKFGQYTAEQLMVWVQETIRADKKKQQQPRQQQPPHYKSESQQQE